MRIIQPVNPTSRIPAFLQKNTKENIIFQLALTVVIIGGSILKEKYETRQFEKHLAELDAQESAYQK